MLIMLEKYGIGVYLLVLVQLLVLSKKKLSRTTPPHLQKSRKVGLGFSREAEEFLA